MVCYQYKLVVTFRGSGIRFTPTSPLELLKLQVMRFAQIILFVALLIYGPYRILAFLCLSERLFSDFSEDAFEFLTKSCPS